MSNQKTGFSWRSLIAFRRTVFFVLLTGLWLPVCASPPTLEHELSRAVQTNDIAKVEDILRRGANPNGEKGDLIPLWIAVLHVDVQMVELLLKAGADPNICDAYSGCPLEIAAVKSEQFHSTEEQGLKLVELLLKAGADPNRCSEDSSCPLLRAVGDSNGNIAKRLLEAGAKPKGAGRYRPLSTALSTKQPDLAKLLMRMDATLAEDDPALLSAAENCDVPSVRLLLKAGQRPDGAKDMYGRTALGVATIKGCADGVAILLKAGAAFALPESSSSSFTTTWFEAIGAANADVLKVFFAVGVNPKARNEDQKTLLHVAAAEYVAAEERGSADSVKLLVEKGVNIDAVDRNGFTPLMAAAYAQGNLNVIQALLDVQANIFLHDQRGKTAKIIAAEAKHADVVGLLERYGAREYTGSRLPFSQFDSEVAGKDQLDVTGDLYEQLPFLRPNLRFFAVYGPLAPGYFDHPFASAAPATLFAVLPGENVVKLMATGDFSKLGLQLRSKEDALRLVRFFSNPIPSAGYVYTRFEDMMFEELPLHSDEYLFIPQETLRKAGIGKPVANVKGTGDGMFFVITRYVVPLGSLHAFNSSDRLTLPSVLRATERVERDGRYSITTETVPTPGLVLEQRSWGYR
jgi:ankyrin repeat protein